MGRLYIKTFSGEDTLAYYEDGQVRSSRYGTDTLVWYRDGDIYISELDFGEHTIACCDSNGNIYAGNSTYGSILAKCKNGVIYEGGSDWNTTLAWYDGDMYGAAAAAAVTLLSLGTQSQPVREERLEPERSRYVYNSSNNGGASNSSRSNNRSQQTKTGNSDTSFAGAMGSLVGTLIGGIIFLIPRIIYYFPYIVMTLLRNPIFFSPGMRKDVVFLMSTLYVILRYLFLLLVWKRLRIRTGSKRRATYIAPVFYALPVILVRILQRNTAPGFASVFDLSWVMVFAFMAVIVWELRKLSMEEQQTEIKRVWVAAMFPFAGDLILNTTISKASAFYIAPYFIHFYWIRWIFTFVLLMIPVLFLQFRDSQKYSQKKYLTCTLISFGLGCLTNLLLLFCVFMRVGMIR